MNPLLFAFLQRLLQLALAAVGGWMISKGWFTESEMEVYITAIVGFALAALWALWQSYKGRLKFLTALATKEPTSEAMLEEKMTMLKETHKLPPASLPKERVPHLGESEQYRVSHNIPYEQTPSVPDDN